MNARVVVAAMCLAEVASGGLGTIDETLSTRRNGQLFVLDAPRDIGSAAGFIIPTDADVAPDGALIVADRSTATLTKLAPDGTSIWEAGGPGQGPGEFSTLMRVSVSPTGQVVALDLTANQVSWFDADGTFRARASLPYRVRQPLSIAALPGDRVAVTGVAARTPGAIHLFERTHDPVLDHVETFGPSPPAQDPRVLNYWGTGWLSLAGDGTLLFTRRLPYEIHRFDPEGSERGMISGPGDFSLGADDFVIRTENGNRVQLSISSTPVPYPCCAHDLGDGWLLAAVLDDSGTNGTWDLFQDGTWTSSIPAPAGTTWIRDVDPANRYIYTFATKPDGESTIYQIPYRIDDR